MFSKLQGKTPPNQKMLRLKSNKVVEGDAEKGPSKAKSSSKAKQSGKDLVGGIGKKKESGGKKVGEFTRI